MLCKIKNTLAWEVPFLKGDARRARKILKWKPKYTIYTLIDEMIENGIKH